MMIPVNKNKDELGNYLTAGRSPYTLRTYLCRSNVSLFCGQRHPGGPRIRLSQQWKIPDPKTAKNQVEKKARKKAFENSYMA